MEPSSNQVANAPNLLKFTTNPQNLTLGSTLALLMSTLTTSVSSSTFKLFLNKKKYAVFSIFFLSAVVAISMITKPRNSQKTTSPLTLSTFAIGKVQPIGYIRSITYPMIYASSRIRSLYVDENDEVRKGAPLFTVEDSKDALYNMESSKANLNQKKAELKSAEAKLLASRSLRDFYKEQSRRYQFLVSNGAATVEQAQQQLTLYEASEHDYLSYLEHVKANKAALSSARWEYRSNKFKSDIATVRAPADVRVFKIFSRAGESIRDGMPVMEVGSSQHMGILAEVYRTDIRKIKLNQNTTITVNGIPAIKWTGKVMKIATQATQQSIDSDNPATTIANRVFNVLIKLSPASSSQAKNFNYMVVNVLFNQ